MPEIVRGRDCIVYFYGDRQPVAIAPEMVASGWAGGQGVQWANAPTDERLVTYSSGLYGGFLVWGSDEASDQYTGMTRQQLAYRYAILFSGGCLMSTTSYERYTYASRVGGGPKVPLVYAPNDVLYLSRRGLWTKEDELTLSGSPLAPAFFTGFVAQIPKGSNRFYLGIQTSMLSPMKTCTKCHHLSEDFPSCRRNRDGLGSWCRKCCREHDQLRRPPGSVQVKARSKAYRDQNRVLLRTKQRARLAETATLKSGSCQDCGGIFPSWSMDFDHVRGEKARGIGQMVGGSRATLMVEVAKCELVCACCHRVRTSDRMARQNVAPRRKLFLRRINELKARPCLDCERSFAPEAMDFDHVRGAKIISVSAMTTWAWDRVLHEVSKCDLVCANCHRTRTQNRIRKVA